MTGCFSSRTRRAVLGATLAWLTATPLITSAAGAAKPETQAAVAMPDVFSADAARAVLNDGGNAVDAAITASFVLAVTYPEAGNIGGGGFMTSVMGGKRDFLDYREMAPAGASRDMYLDDKGEVTDASLIGPLASGVPGAVAGMAEAHKKFASLPWARLLAPAIALARDGFVVPENLAGRIARVSKRFEGRTNFSTVFNAKAGERLRQPDLADTLERIATLGAKDFYTGKTAGLTAAMMKKTGGLITREDLAGYKAIWRSPLIGTWRDRTIVTAPPPSSGGVALLQLLGMKAALDDTFKGKSHNTPAYIHLIAEIEKRVFADRAVYMGDPDFVTVPVAKLIDPAYIARRAREVSPDSISGTDDVKAGLEESLETTHFSVVDFQGNAVAVTTTLNGSFGSGVVVEGAGYLLNNEMDDFSAKPGTPNLYGVIGGEANAIEPRKRMLSSMTPTIVLDGDRVQMVIGSPGGPTIFTSVFQVIVNQIDYGLSPADAVSTGRFHHQLLPKDMILFERRIKDADATQKALETMGYRIRPVDGYGDIQLISIDGKTIKAVADPRARGVAHVIDPE